MKGLIKNPGFLGLTFFILGFPLSLQAQPSMGHLQGVVYDANRHPLPGVSLTLIHPSGLTFSTVSDQRGRFLFKDVPPGKGFRLKAEAPGFLPYELTDLVIEPSPKRELVITLHLKSEEVVVVSARRMKTNNRHFATRIDVISRDALVSTPAPFLDDSLRDIPGFSLFRRSGSLSAHPTTQGFSFRGMWPNASSRGLALMDGLPLNDPFGSWVYWNRVPRTAIKEIEIVEIPISSAWGPSGLGGSLLIHTGLPDDERMVLNLQYGGLDSFDLDSSFHLPTGTGAFLISGRYFRTDGFFLIPPERTGPIDRRVNYRFGTIYTRGTISLSEHLEFILAGNFYTEDRQNGTPYRDNHTTIGMISTGLRWRPDSDNIIEVNVMGQTQNFRSRFSALNSERTEERPTRDQFSVPSFMGAIQLTWQRRLSSGGQWTLGSDVMLIRAETNEKFLWNGQHFLRKRTIGGHQRYFSFFWLFYIPLSEQWNLQGGARFGTWSFIQGRQTNYDLMMNRIISDKFFKPGHGLQFSPIAGLRWSIDPRISFRVLISRGFRLPTLNELYRPFQVGQVVTAANPELKPENMTTLEMGLEGKFHPYADYSVTAFWNRLEDAVANVTVMDPAQWSTVCGFVPPGGLCRQRQAIHAKVVGFNTRLRLEPWRVFKLTFAYQWQNGKVTQSPNPLLLERRLPQSPEHQLTLRLDVAPLDPLQMTIRFRYESSRYEDLENTLVLKPAMVFDLGASFKIRPELRVWLKIENVWNERVETGIRATGLVQLDQPRLLLAGIEYRL